MGESERDVYGRFIIYFHSFLWHYFQTIIKARKLNRERNRAAAAFEFVNERSVWKRVVRKFDPAQKRRQMRRQKRAARATPKRRISDAMFPIWPRENPDTTHIADTYRAAEPHTQTPHNRKCTPIVNAYMYAVQLSSLLANEPTHILLYTIQKRWRSILFVQLLPNYFLFMNHDRFSQSVLTDNYNNTFIFRLLDLFHVYVQHNYSISKRNARFCVHRIFLYLLLCFPNVECWKNCEYYVYVLSSHTWNTL